MDFFISFCYWICESSLAFHSDHVSVWRFGLTVEASDKHYFSRLWLENVTIDQSKKLQQFTKLCKGDMSQNSKKAKMVLGPNAISYT